MTSAPLRVPPDDEHDRRLVGHVHPQGEALEAAAGACTRGRLTPLVKRLFATFLRWRL